MVISKKDLDILIIDDNKDLCNNLLEIFESRGYRSKTAYTGKEALKICKNYHFTVVLTDINLPDYNGLELIKQMQNKFSGMEYIIITGNASLKSAIEAIRNREILNYEQKPLDLERLLHFIDQLFDRKETEENLAERERQLSNLMDNLPGMAYRCLDNANWTMKYLSSGCRDLTGYPAEELIDDKIVAYNDLIHPADRELVAANISNKIEADQSYQIEYRIITKNGEEKWVWEQGRAIKINNKNFLEGLILDITERRIAQEKLEKSEKRYRALFNYSHDAIMTLEPPDWNFGTANPTFLEMFRIDKDVDITNFWPGKLSPDRQPDGSLSSKKAIEMIDIAVKEGVNFFEWQHKRMDGEEFPATVLLNKVVLEDKIFIQATIRDITKRKQTLEALKKSEKKYQRLIQQSNDAIYLLYKDKFEIINQKFEELFGVTQEEVRAPDFDFMDLVAPKSKQLVKQRRKAILSGDKVSSRYEFTALDKNNNEIEVEVSVSYFSYKNGIATQGILRDITERKKMQQQLQQTQKLESIGNLAAGVAHDFNNILTVIQGNAQMADSKISRDSSISTYLHNVIDSSKKAASLTEQLLLFSRKQAMDFKPINLNSVIRGVLDMLQRLIGENIEIETNLVEDVGTIKADKNNIEQIIMNMAINAKDAMPEGGKLSIRTENLTISEAEKQKLEHSETGEFTRLIIEDNGIGIKEENLDRIFDPFFTTKGMAKGTGMGLSVVYGIIKKHRGWINVRSEPGEGTKFLIDFPAIQEKIDKKDNQEVPIDKLSGNGEKILLIEDNPDVLKVGRIILENNDYVVDSATNAKDALAKFNKNKEYYDLIISDVVLPDKNGLEIANQIRSTDPHKPIILCSGYTDERSRRSEIAQNEYTFIQKPFHVKKMLKEVNALLRSKKA
ncbi:MAG: response regulator [Candidatus Marinimicrobia bacterium]|nr:response regulator [Candidatus Neomarinimicrobiota bacterium]